MDIRQLRYFVRVIELKSFTRAAEVLHVAQPALGVQIRKLEDELHSQLLVRHSRGVEPTPAGSKLQEHAYAILQQVEETKQAIRDFSGPPRGTVRLATTPSIHPRIAVGLIQRSAVELPNIHIEMREAMTATLLDWIREGKVDLGLVYLADGRPEGILAEDLATEGAVFVQGLGARARPATIGMAEVCRHSLAMPGRPHHLRSLLQESADREGLEPQIGHEIGGIGTILELVERNIAASVLPAGVVARYIERGGRVAARVIVDPALRLTVSLVRSPHHVLSNAEVILRKILADLVDAEGMAACSQCPGPDTGTDAGHAMNAVARNGTAAIRTMTASSRPR